MNILEGTVVVELASVLAGPSVGQFLSELGAKVLKVEHPENGDVTRNWKLPSEKSSTDVSAYFATVNWGKQSLPLNLHDNKDLEHLYKVIAKADFVISSFKYGDAQKLKVDYKTFSGYNSKLIYAEISGFGTDVNRVGYDAVIQAETGFMSMNGTKESGPLKMPVALMDILAAHHLKEGILSAYIHRLKTGEGNYVSISLLDAGLSSLANQGNNFLMQGKVAAPIGNEHPNIFPYGTVFFSKDNKGILLAIGSDKQFIKLCEILNIQSISVEPKFLTNALRVANRDTLRPLLFDTFKNFDTHYLKEAFLAKNIPFGSIHDLSEVFQHFTSEELILKAGEITGIRQQAFKILKGNDPIILKPPNKLREVGK